MKIGITCEGPRDIRPLITIIRKIFAEHSIVPEFSDKLTNMPYTGIIGYVKLYTKKMFDDGAQIAVYCTDQDRCEDNITSRIKEKIKEINPLYLDLCAVGVPDPHFEAWLLADEDNIKNFFNLEGAEPLPYPSFEPKKRLAKLQDSMDVKISIYEISDTLSKNCNLSKMKLHSPQFNNFYKEISLAIKTAKA